MRKLLLLFLITIVVLGDTSAEGTTNNPIPPCVLHCADAKLDLNHNEFDAKYCKMMQDYGACVVNTCNNNRWAQVLRNKILKLMQENSMPCEVNF